MIIASQRLTMAEALPASEPAPLQLEDDAVALLCHKLRTPLTAAMGFLQLALRDARSKPDSAAQLDMLEMADQQLRRMSSMINDIAERLKA
jgi:signal transduction histidine kinase